MSNMSYCRFENTYRDLQDCAYHITDDLEDKSDEKRYRNKLINLCKIILDNVESFERNGAERIPVSKF